MPRLGRTVVPSYPHHIVQRGHNKQVVFAEPCDFECYLTTLAVKTIGDRPRFLSRSLGNRGLSPIVLEDCLSSAAKEISIHDKETYFQYQDLMEEFNTGYGKPVEAYYESFEMIAMLAGQTELGKRFEKLDAESGEERDRTWQKQACRAVKDKTLTKKLLRKSVLAFRCKQKKKIFLKGHRTPN